MTIHTFYRPDSAMINTLINNMVGANEGIKNPNGHRFTAILKVTGSSEALAKLNEHERSTGPSYFGSAPQIEIGVSLSQITLDDFKRLANTSNGTNCSQYFSIVSSIDHLKVEPTQVPNLYVGQYGYYWLNKIARTGNEAKFAELLKGFDFYYEYSDDSRIHRNGDKLWNDIRAQGKDMGLSDDTMNRIYREEAGM